MSTFSLRKRVLAGVSAVALAISAFAGVLTSDMFSFDKVEAYGSVAGGYGNLPTSSGGEWKWTLSDGGGSCGVRIYLAKKTMCDTYNNSTGLRKETLYQLHENNLGNKGTAKDYALYALSPNAERCEYIKDGTIKAYTMLGDNSSKTLEIDTSQVMLNNNFGGSAWGFDNSPASYSDWLGSDTQDTTSLMEWCNANLGGENFTAANLDTFLGKYSSQIGASVYKDAGLPTNSANFFSQGWTLVVEPVLVVSFRGQYHILSYQDFFGYGTEANATVLSLGSNGRKCTANSYLGLYFNSDSEGELSSANSTIYNAIHDGCGGFYSDYEDSSLKFRAKSSAGSRTAGFGVFGVNKSIYLGDEEAHINKHYSLYADQSNGNYTLNWKGGAGCNEGLGQTAIALKEKESDGKSIFKWNDAAVSGSNITNKVWKTPITQLKIYSSGSTSKALSLKDSDGNLKKAVASSDTDTTLMKLVGTSDMDTLATNVSSKYLISESAIYTFKFTGKYDVSKLLDAKTSVAATNIGVSVGVPLAITPKKVGNNPLYTQHIGSNFAVNLDFNPESNTDNVKLKNVAEALCGKMKTAFGSGGSQKLFTEYAGYGMQTLTSDKVRNIWGNTNTYATSQSSTYINRNLNTFGRDNVEKTVSLTFDYFVQDHKVKSAKASIKRNEGENPNNITVGSTTKSGEYSIFSSTGSHIIDNAKLGASGVSYVVAFPNSKANEKYSLMTSNGKNNFKNLIFAEGLYYNNINGYSSLSKVLNKISGVNVIPVGSEEKFNYYAGAYRDVGTGTSNSFVGYSVYIVDDLMTTPNQETSMQLKAYEANFVYPTLLGDTEGHIVRTVGTTGLSTRQSFSNIWISKTDKYKGSAISRETVYTNLFDLMYSTAKISGKNQYFAPEADNPKKFENSGSNGIWLNHQVNLSRGTFGEDMVASSFSTKNRSTFSDDYITKTLGYSLGTSGASSPEGLTAGKTSKLSSGLDVYSWACNRLVSTTLTFTNFDGTVYSSTYSSNPYLTGESVNNAGYKVDEKSYRYVTNDRGTGKGTSAKLEVDTSHDYHGLFSKSYDDVLNFYPEVDMVAYTYDATSNKLSTSNGNANNIAVAQTRLAALGEKKRTVNPTGVFAVRVVSNTNPLVGVTKSDTVATGSDAKALSKKFGNLQVIYAGGNVNLSAESSYAINVSGFVLDQIDSNVDGKNGNKIVSAMGSDTAYNAIIADNSDLKSIWGNSNYKPEEKYAAWVESFKGSLAVDVSLDTCKKANGDGVVKTYTGFKVSQSKVTGGNVLGTTSYALTYKNGDVVNDDAYKALIRCIADEYFGDTSNSSLDKAKQLFTDSGINKSILDSIESNTDADNGSEKAEAFGNKKWYDEQVRTFVVRYYKCEPVKIGKVLVSDKIDINAGPSQDKNTHTLFQNGYVGRWNMTVYLSKAVDQMPDMEYYVPKKGNLAAAQSAGSVLIANKHIEGADFIISDATTADARN